MKSAVSPEIHRMKGLISGHVISVHLTQKNTSMKHSSKYLFITVPLLVIAFLLQSCEEQEVRPEKQTVQFDLSIASSQTKGSDDASLPNDARARITVTASNGTVVLDGREVSVYKSGDKWLTEAIDLEPGSYAITEMIVVSDSTELFATPKQGAELATSDMDALPYNFAIRPKDALTLSIPIIDIRFLDLIKLGYPASKRKTLPIEVYQDSKLTAAKAEIWQDRKLIQTLKLSAGTNGVELKGDDKKPYTITVYTSAFAKTETFLLKDIQKKIGKKAWALHLIPALIFNITSYDDGETYDFNFRMEGTGSVGIWWGDGGLTATSVPFEVGHNYAPAGNYTLIVTGNLNQITDFSGFSYSTIMTKITGLTNLTALKVYDPSWGAVPIKVDLSKCKQLERINIAKYGAPFETINLATDFKLPSDHYIKTFIFDATSFDMNREFISQAELAAFVNNIHANAVARNITDGKFFVNPVESPNAATQAKLDILVNTYDWQVGFNDDIYNAWGRAAAGRKSSDLDSRREQWLRERFSNSDQIIESGRAAATVK